MQRWAGIHSWAENRHHEDERDTALPHSSLIHSIEIVSDNGTSQNASGASASTFRSFTEAGP